MQSLSSYSPLNSGSERINNVLSAPLHNSRQDIYEYLLVIPAGKEIKEQLAAERLQLVSRYETGVNGKSEANITVMRFMASENMEATLTRWLQRICSQQESFIVTLNNYSGYPPGNIHIRVLYSQAFEKLGKELKVIDNYVKSYGLPAANISSHPHLTLAKHMPEKLYIKALFDYAQRDFSNSFIANDLVLLKRKNTYDEPKKINVLGLAPGQTATAFSEQLIIF